MNKPLVTPFKGKLAFTIPNNTYNEDTQGFEYLLDTSLSYYLVSGNLGRLSDKLVRDCLDRVRLAKINRFRRQGRDETEYSWALLDFGGHFVIFTSGGLEVYTSEPSWALMKIEEVYAKYRKEDKKDEPSFNLIRAHPNGYASEEVSVRKSFPKTDLDLVAHYGEEILPYRDELFRYLKTTPSGIHIMLGDPGTGKTTFIRYLISKAPEHCKFYFIPPQCYGDLGSTKLLDFLRAEQEDGEQDTESKLFLILEDSEALLLPRKEGSLFSISEVLNLSDGLLGEGMDLHFICTINCGLDALDSAITRPGRLLTSQSFNSLSAEQALNLAHQLKRTLTPGKKEYTLAEIYHTKAKILSTRPVMGFK